MLEYNKNYSKLKKNSLIFLEKLPKIISSLYSLQLQVSIVYFEG